MYTGSLGTVSNREDWIQEIEVVDDNGVGVDISAATITLAVRKKGDGSPVLQASVGDGITISTPIFTFEFDVADMSQLCAGSYEVGVTVTRVGTTNQLIAGTVSIIDGIVP